MDKTGTLPICGIIRPIADTDGYPPGHWREVHDIIVAAISSAKYQGRLVSESDAAGVILSEIVTNIYNDPIVVCDVSGRNPNVMFELGLRIAFEKPVVVISDDATPFSFDISVIKHLRYPASLRHVLIENFKEELCKAISATVANSSDPKHRNYLQQFGPISVTNLGANELSLAELANDIRVIKSTINRITPESAVVNSEYVYKDAMKIAAVALSQGKFKVNIYEKQMKQLISILNRYSDAVEGYDPEFGGTFINMSVKLRKEASASLLVRMFADLIEFTGKNGLPQEFSFNV